MSSPSAQTTSKGKRKSSALTFEEREKLMVGRELSDTMKHTIHEWSEYHREKGKAYKSERGFKTFLTTTENAVKTYGEDIAIKTFELSMSNNYDGLYYERVAQDQKGGNTNGSSKRDSPGQGADGDRKEPVYGSYEWYRSVGWKED